MAEKVKIARQGMTWRHIAIVVTMCLSIFTAVGIIFTAAGLCYRPVAQHFGVPVSQVSLYITFVYLGQMAGGVPGGLLFDKFNAKPFVASQLSWSLCLTSDSLSIQRSGAIG